MRRVVIVGANLAGGRAAEALRAGGFDGEIVLIGAEPHRPYERPPLSKEILRGEWDASRSFLRDESWYADNAIELRLGVRAVAVSPSDRTVSLEDGAAVSCDAVLLATGGRPRTLDVPGGDLPGVHTLRTIDDAAAVAACLSPGAPVVVIGAGFIGAEVAASARMQGCDVTMVEVLDVPMSRALGEEVGRIYGDIHRERGVRLLTGTGVERIEAGADGRAARVVTSTGERLDAAVVVVGIGIVPNVELAESAGCEVGNGVVVDEWCRTSVPGIFAAGDVALHPNPFVGERVRLEHWQNAQNQAAAAARSMLGGSEPFAEVPWFWSDQYDLNLQMFGHPRRWDFVVFRGDVPGRSFAAYYLDEGRVVAALGVNRAKDVRGAKPLIEKGPVVEASVLADESADLRKLAKTL